MSLIAIAAIVFIAALPIIRLVYFVWWEKNA